MTLVVIDAVGLTPRALTHMPRLRRLAGAGFQARVDPVLPAVTCSVQSSFVTGLEPTDHGIVGNGWYFRDLGEVFLWRQHNKLVQGEKVWETARRAKPDFKVANVCWWYAMGDTTDLTVTPRPIYFADGKKEPDCYTRPPALHDRLTGALGEFPLFTYWGPTANITSSRWIAQAARKLLDEEQLDMLLVYLPHLDYDPQRFGPGAAESAAAAAELDDVAGALVEHAQARGDTVVVLSEYGITDARRPVDVNRALRRAGLLEVYV
ncbi:MAG: nucleotide pyrophosphatase/phosphodiesterase family protein, partial [Solirubrobacteraceae bacterium]